MKRSLLVGTCFAILSMASYAGSIVFVGHLSPEQLGATGSGDATVTYDDVAHTLNVQFDFTGLSGVTTVAHIHCCIAPPGTTMVATYPGTFPNFPAGVTFGSYDSSIDGPGPIDLTDPLSYTSGFLALGDGTAAGGEATLLSGLMGGQAYLNVHSSTFGGGEIRSFLAQVPEPGSSALLVAGFAALAAFRLRRRKALTK